VEDAKRFKEAIRTDPKNPRIIPTTTEESSLKFGVDLESAREKRGKGKGEKGQARKRGRKGSGRAPGRRKGVRSLLFRRSSSARGISGLDVNIMVYGAMLSTTRPIAAHSQMPAAITLAGW